jgi:hypothetical protein
MYVFVIYTTVDVNYLAFRKAHLFARVFSGIAKRLFGYE